MRSRGIGLPQRGGRWVRFAAPSDKRRAWRRLGPGLITGASDVDPSGIATYLQAGARFGFALLWTQSFALPLVAAVQEISARLGRVTGHGIAGNVRRHYSRRLLYPVVLLLVVANTINLAADIGAMADAVRLLVGGPSFAYALLFAAVSVGVEMFVPYRRFEAVMKWLALALLAYVATAFCVRVDWAQVLRHALVPSLAWGRNYLAMLIAILGTTISPYLFFWQAALETEERRAGEGGDGRGAGGRPLRSDPEGIRREFGRIRFDTYVGVGAAQVVAFFIVVTAGATLHGRVADIRSSAEAAAALGPLAGRYAQALFALGIVGTGLLAVPALAGSSAYAVGEALGWPTGLDRKPLDAAGFYGVVAAATLIGLTLNATAFNPIRALVLAAVINGVVAVPVMAVMLRMARDERVMGPFARISRPLCALGWLATLVMAAAAVGLFVTGT